MILDYDNLILKEKNLRYGLRFKLIIVVFTGLFIGFIPLGIYSIVQAQKAIEQEIITSGQERIQIAAESLANLLIAYDYTNMESLAERIIQLQDVEKITVTNKSNKIMTSRTRAQTIIGENSRHFEKTIIFDKAPIGKVEIWLSPIRLTEKLENNYLRIIIMLSIFACFFGALIYVTISVVILKPISRFRDSMINILNNPPDELSANLEITSQDEIGELAMIFNEMYKKIYSYQRLLKEKNIRTGLELDATQHLLIQSSKMASLGEMAGNIAHEINNPLAIISGKSEKLLRLVKTTDSEKKSLTEEIQKIIKTTDRIAKIVKGLRTFSRDGKKDPFQKIKLAVILDTVTDLCNERLNRHQVSFVVKETLTPDFEIECRESQIIQIIFNLIGNSIDAITPLSEKWIRLEVEVIDPQWVVFSVTDSGNGIPAHIAAKIIEPFFTTKEKGKGTGLGLSISHSIALDHGGTLSINSACSNTCFVLKIPFIQQSQERNYK